MEYQLSPDTHKSDLFFDATRAHIPAGLRKCFIDDVRFWFLGCHVESSWGLKREFDFD